MIKGFKDWSLASCEIVYRLPDHPLLVQTMLWQTVDTNPDFPKIRKYLEWWDKNIEGPLVGVRIAHRSLIKPSDFRFTEGRLIIQ